MSVKPTLVELILNATAVGKSMLTAANAAAQKTLLSLVKGDVGLGNVDNTSDANKPVSTAAQTALDAKQATLVSGTNIKTINSTSLLGSGDISVGGIGGSTGATDNRVLRSDGTGAATLQNSPLSVDDSGNVTGIVSQVISRGTNAGNAALTTGGSGGGTTRVNDNGTVVINGDAATGTYPLKLQYNSGDRFLFGYLGDLGMPVVGQPINLGQGVLHVTTASGSRSLVKSYVNLELCPGSLGGGGTIVEINSGTAGTYRDLKLRDMTASGLICAGTYTVGTLPSAAANAYKFATVSDSSVTTFGSTVAGGGSSKVQVYSNGSNWTVCAA